MKKLTQLAVGMLFAASATVSTSAFAEGEVSYNIGFASEYYFRGAKQKESSASAGVDYENSGFYIGTWAADVGDGLEVDGYFGYGMELDNGFTASLGFTGYYYTGEQFDDTYEEVNLNLGFGLLGVEYSVGEWDGFGTEQDYDFLALTVAGENGWYGTYGAWGKDFDGDYFEIGYGTEIGGFDVGIAAIFSDEDLSDETDTDGSAERSEAIVFTLGKTF